MKKDIIVLVPKPEIRTNQFNFKFEAANLIRKASTYKNTFEGLY